MSDEIEDGESEELDCDYYPEPPLDTMDGPDGQVHFGYDAQTFLLHWVNKLGLDMTGAAVIFGQECGIWIVHPETGELLTPETIAKRAKGATIRRVQ